MNAPKFSMLLLILFLFIHEPGHAAKDSNALFAPSMQLLENGRNDQALELLKILGDTFAADNKPAEQAEALLYIGQAYLQSGRYEKANAHLLQSEKIARSVNARVVLAKSLNLLGSLFVGTSFSQEDGKDADRIVRSVQIVERDRALGYLNEALLLAIELYDFHLGAAVLNNQGNLFAGRKNFADAAKKYVRALNSSDGADNASRATVLTNLSALHCSFGEYAEAEKYAVMAYQLFESLPHNADKLAALIKIGKTLRNIATNLPTKSAEIRTSAHLAFKSALSCADKLRDTTGSGYALGYNGTTYEDAGDYRTALDLTMKALFAAQLANSHEQLALWQWQLGRLHSALGNEPASLASYKSSLSALQQLKQSVPSDCSECSIPFKELMEPVYMGILELMFKRADKAGFVNEQKTLSEIRDTIESFRTAELQDFFKDTCVTTRRNSTTSNKSPDSTAVIYYAILPGRLEILTQFPTGFKRYSVNVDSRTLQKNVTEFRNSLNLNSATYVSHAKQLYDIMLRPFMKDLTAGQITTLVIIPDGILRTIPVAALHDGSDFVVAKYALAVTQGIQLTDTSPVSPESRSILIAGISEGILDYPALPNVASELKGISAIFDSTTLLNSEFSINALKTHIEKKPYSMIHLATHGEFAGDINKMFVLAYDGPIKFNQLDRFIKVTKYKDTPLELLTLSACKTAAGDDRAALGLAGIAVKAGAKGTMATLWEIDDKATSELVVEFYRQLKIKGTSKSQALRNAQLQLMKEYPHPYYWSPFLMIGNWL